MSVTSDLCIKIAADCDSKESPYRACVPSLTKLGNDLFANEFKKEKKSRASTNGKANNDELTALDKMVVELDCMFQLLKTKTNKFRKLEIIADCNAKCREYSDNYHAPTKLQRFARTVATVIGVALCAVLGLVGASLFAYAVGAAAAPFGLIAALLGQATGVAAGAHVFSLLGAVGGGFAGFYASTSTLFNRRPSETRRLLAVVEATRKVVDKETVVASVAAKAPAAVPAIASSKVPAKAPAIAPATVSDTTPAATTPTFK